MNEKLEGNIQANPSRADYEPIDDKFNPNNDLVVDNIPNESSPLLGAVLGPSSLVPSDDNQQSSIVTIFAIWNMMMGTSLLSMPWAYSNAGLFGGLIVIFIMGFICFYTASLVLTIPGSLQVDLLEYGDLVALLLGPLCSKLSQVSSISILAGGSIVYWILMNNFLRNIVTFIYEVSWLNVTVSLNASSVICANSLEAPQILSRVYDSGSTPSHDSETVITFIKYGVPAFLVLVQGPLICLRSVSIFLKFNFVGTFAVFFLLAFGIFKAIAWGVLNVNFTNPHADHFIPLFSWNTPAYSGVLSLALFIHNCLTTIMKTQRNPRNNFRDLAIAYILVVTTYLLLGVGIYVSFPLNKSCLRDNFLDNLESNDLYAFIARSFLLIQIFTLFPLLCYMVRVQVLSLFPRPRSITDTLNSNPPNESLRIILLNIVLLTCCLLFGFFFPQIGTVIRYCGSFSGLILTFTLPPIMLFKSRKQLQLPTHWSFIAVLSAIVAIGLANFILQFTVKV